MILDLGLPDVDGTEVIRTLRYRGYSLPIIVLSGRNTSQDRVDAMELGANYYLSKPLDVTELVGRIDTLTDPPRSVLAAGVSDKRWIWI